MDINKSLAHELDAAWLVELYLRIHGGDPGPEGVISGPAREAVSAHIVSAVARNLDADTSQALHAAIAPLNQRTSLLKLMDDPALIESRLNEMGYQILSRPAEATEHVDSLTEEERNPPPRMYCFRHKGQTICTEVGPHRPLKVIPTPT